MRTITSSIKVYGTAAERIAMRDSDIPDNQEITFVEDDTGNVYYWDGDSWTQTHSGGAAHVRTVATDIVDPHDVVEYRQITLDGATSDTYEWTDFDQYTHLTVLATIAGGTTSRASVYLDTSSDQSGRYTPAIGFKSIAENENGTTALVNFATTNAGQRSGISASKVKFATSTTGAGETITLDVIARKVSP